MDGPNYLNSTIKQFEYYKALGERAMAQLNEQQLLHQPQSESNSIAIIVNHLHGNMKSRWTDFLDSDGEKSWRKRDQEFEDTIKNKDQLYAKWYEGWQCLLGALGQLAGSDLDKTILIRNQQHTVYEAINRQLAHYAYHIGQMVFLAKMLAGPDWHTLSIAKGQSRQFNQDKFDKGVHGDHYSDDFTDQDATT